MELIRGQHNLRPEHQGCVATIGNFDGVHRGHQAILAQLTAIGQAEDLPTTLMTFEPLPREFFAPGEAPARLSRLTEKLTLLQRYGLDRVLCVRFDRAFAALSPEQFIRWMLVEGLGVRHLIVGDDFRFGCRASGDYPLLVKAGREHGFKVSRQTTFCLDDERISSTRVRSALAEGDLVEATRLLGRPYSMSGRVVGGDRIGRTLDYPTANIPIDRCRSPLTGVFAVRVYGLDDQPLPGMANIGTRPTIDGDQPRFEVHLFDFDRDIYGRRVEVEFIHFLRAERRFDSLDGLRQQLHEDARQARALL